MPFNIEGKQLLEQQRAKTRQAIGNKFASAFGKMASAVLPSGEQPVLGQSGIPQFDDYQNRAVAEAKSMAEIQAAKQGFPNEEAKRAWIINYLTTRFSEDPEFKNADPTKLPEWALRDDIKDPIAEIKAAKQKKEELKGQASLNQSAFTKGSVKMPTDEEASADVAKIKLMLGEDYTHPLKPSVTSASVKTTAPAPSPMPQMAAPSVESSAPATTMAAPAPAVAPAVSPIMSAYSAPVEAPSPLLPTTATAVSAPKFSEGDHPWLGDGYKNYISKPMQAAYSKPVKQFGSAEEAFKAAPYATEVSKVEGMGYVPKAVPLSVGEEVAENVRRSKSDIAAKGLGSESDVEDTDMAKPMRVTNPYSSSQYRTAYQTRNQGGSYLRK
jgi:hypothetical protein